MNKTKVIFAGANRPLFYFTQYNHELQSLKGDRKTIGGRPNEEENQTFTNNEFWLDTGDMIYLTSDGLADQGNLVHEKFGTKKIRELLSQIASLPLSEQNRLMEKQLALHQQNAEQTDDITILGIQI